MKNRKNRKSKGLSYGRAVRIALSALKKNALRTFFSVVLLSVCCGVLGFVLCLSIIDYDRKQLELFRANQSDTISFAKFDWRQMYSRPTLLSSPINGPGSVHLSNIVNHMDEDKIEEIKDRTGLNFSYIYGSPVHIPSSPDEVGTNTCVMFDASEYYTYLCFPDFDRYEAALRLEAKDYSYYLDYVQTAQDNAKYRAHSDHSAAFGISYATQQYLYLDENELSDFDCELLAGRLPESLYEIAVSECVLDDFIDHGYCLYEDVLAGEVVLPIKNLSGIVLNKDEIAALEIAVQKEINSAEDMLGLELPLYGSVENKSINFSASYNSFYMVKVVGVIDTGCSLEKVHSNLNGSAFTVRDKIFVSREWTEHFFPDGSPFTIIAPRPTEKAQISECLALNEQVLDEVCALQYGEYYGKYAYMIAGEGLLLEIFDNMLATYRTIKIFFTPCALLVGVFAMLLTAALITASIEKHRREIGILRSLGASKGDVNKIFLTECLLIGAAVFVVSVAIVLILLSWASTPSTTLGVRIETFDPIHAVILFAICLLMPTLSGWFALRKITKRSPTDILSGSPDRKQKKKK